MSCLSLWIYPIWLPSKICQFIALTNFFLIGWPSRSDSNYINYPQQAFEPASTVAIHHVRVNNTTISSLLSALHSATIHHMSAQNTTSHLHSEHTASNQKCEVQIKWSARINWHNPYQSVKATVLVFLISLKSTIIHDRRGSELFWVVYAHLQVRANNNRFLATFWQVM